MDKLLLFNAHSHSVSTEYTSILQLTFDHNVVDSTTFSVGIHPKDAAIDPVTKANFLTNSTSQNCLAIGEIGLDTRIELSLETQEKCYIEQLELAHSLNLPIILHCVNSWDRCRFLHSKHAPQQTLIYHGFSKASIVQQVLTYHPSIISIGASILNNKALQDQLHQIPLSRMLLETDDSTVDLIAIYTKVAELKSLSLPALIETINKNAKRIFKL